MLILPHVSLLNDGLLNREDALAKYKEQTFQKENQFRLPDQAQLTNMIAQAGVVMTSDQMVRKILKIKLKPIWVEDSIGYPGAANFYMEFDGKKLCLNAPFKKGRVPEFSFLHEDERGLVVDKTPGWRDVLKRLIDANVLLKSQVDRAFGIPSINEASSRWFQSTRKFN